MSQKNDIKKWNPMELKTMNHKKGFWTPFVVDDIFDFDKKNIFDLFKPELQTSPSIYMESENDEEVVIFTDLPGVKKEDIDIECDGDILTIDAKRNYKNGAKMESCLSKRSAYLGFKMDENSITASLEDGVLTIKIRKSKEGKNKKIEIT